MPCSCSACDKHAEHEHSRVWAGLRRLDLSPESRWRVSAAQELARRSAVGIEQATADAAALLRQLRTARLVTP